MHALWQALDMYLWNSPTLHFRSKTDVPFNEVQSRGGLYHRGDLAGLQRERGFLEFLLHVALPEEPPAGRWAVSEMIMMDNSTV